jgi:hypothetical protein
MGYSNFKKMSQVTNRFGLEHQLGDIFSKIKPVKPSRWLRDSLIIAHEMPLTNEKVKAEKLISPILSEVVRSYKTQLTLFSGEELTVDSSKDLAGACDFFFALHPPKVEMEAPIVSLAEAKDEDMEGGTAQCAAQMYGAYLFNEQHKRPVSVIFGCATTGIEWKFLKLENGVFTIDRQSFTDISDILGAWHQVIQTYIEKY